MTENTNTFAARLRELIHASSLPPWEASGEVIYDPVAAIGEMYDGANADFVVYIRNHADRLADLVERVEAYREATDVRETFSAEGPHDDTMTLARLCTAEANAYRAMLAALDSLNGGGA